LEGAVDKNKEGFRYLHGTTSCVLCYQGRSRLYRVLYVHGFFYADQTGDLDSRRYTSGYALNLFGGEISWMRKRQFVVALSTTKFEYMEPSHARKEAIWL
jgi:hypothetical protein